MSTQIFYIDGTFKLVKLPFIQLFSIRGFIIGETKCKKQVKLTHSNMSRCSTNDYIAVLEILKSIFGPQTGTLSPQRFMLDFESATWQATHQSFPGAIIRGL